MPVRKRIDKRRAELTDEGEAWLHGDDKAAGFVKYAPDHELAALWAAHSERIVAEHVTDHPGSRPTRWWRYQAPEPRKRLGGTGTPAHDVLAYKPIYRDGLPAIWVTPWQVKYYGGTAVDIHGAPIGSLVPTDFKGVAIDPENPPIFESVPAFLKRHKLFLPGEERRLRKADFEEETVSRME
jgi:hypothetical protein